MTISTKSNPLGNVEEWWAMNSHCQEYFRRTPGRCSERVRSGCEVPWLHRGGWDHFTFRPSDLCGLLYVSVIFRTISAKEAEPFGLDGQEMDYCNTFCWGWRRFYWVPRNSESRFLVANNTAARNLTGRHSILTCHFCSWKREIN